MNTDVISETAVCDGEVSKPKKRRMSSKPATTFDNPNKSSKGAVKNTVRERRRADRLWRKMNRIYQLERHLNDLKTDARLVLESRGKCKNCKRFLVLHDESHFLYELYENPNHGDFRCLEGCNHVKC
jgi:hypothetical protein